MNNAKNIWFISSYIPRECGIATYTDNLIQSIGQNDKTVKCSVVAMEKSQTFKYSSIVKTTIKQEIDADYVKAAEMINNSDCNVVSLQHEFSIFGGYNGSKILLLLQNIKKPVVLTAHTVSIFSDKPYKIRPRRYKTRLKLLKKIIDYSQSVTVMSKTSKDFLTTILGVPADKIIMIPHGAPVITEKEISNYKSQIEKTGFNEKDFVISSFGLISPKKGLEYMIRALPAIIKANPGISIKYLIAGRMHPDRKDNYIGFLKEVATKLNVSNNVVFDSKYLTFEEIYRYLVNSSIYITPYYSKELASSGTLTYALGCGCCIVSTPYIYANDLIVQNKVGELVEFKDHRSISKTINGLIRNKNKLSTYSKNSYNFGQEITWPKVGKMFYKAFDNTFG